MEVTTALIVQDEQVVALRLVGSKDALVATVSQYFFASVTAPQLNIGVVETPVDPFVGDESNGAEKPDCVCVVRDHFVEY